MENYFGSLTQRLRAFREEVLDEKPYIDAERAVLATEAYRENQNQPRVMVRALMLKKILEGMTIYIDDKSLIAGNQATKNTNAPIFPEYTMEFVLNELDSFEKRDGDVFYITEETKQQLREIAPFWENNNLRARGEALLPEEVNVFMETGVFGMEGKLNSYYINDLNSGAITKEDALELLTCLWIKTLTVNKVRSQAHTLSSAGSPMYQNVTIGGQTVDKKD